MIRRLIMMGASAPRLQLAGAVLAGAWMLAGCASPYGSPVIDRSAETGDARPAAVPAAPPAAPAPRPDSYTVQKGDTLFGIARRFGLPYRELGDWNGIDPTSAMRVGQVLRLNPPDSPVVAYAIKLDAPPEGRVVAEDAAVQKPTPAVPTAPAVPGVPGPVPPGVSATPGASVTPVPAGGGAGQAAAPGSPAADTPGGAAPGADVPLKTEPKAVKLPYSAQTLSQLQKSAAATPDASAATDGGAAGKAPAGPKPPASGKSDATVAQDRKATDKATPDPAGDTERVEWVWPTNGKVASGFNESTKGIQLSGAPGQSVVASAAGLVTYVGSDLRGYGRMVVIKHNKTFLSVYTNNSQVLVKEGQSVARGQKIAEMGTSEGDTVALHFEIRRMGKPVDPMKFLPNDRS